MEKIKNGTPSYEVGFIADAPFVNIQLLEAFTKKLNQKPGKVDNAQGFETIPISTVETELDEDFAGMWETENFRWQVVANEIVGAIDLKIFHPVAKVWLKRSGSAAVMIQMEKGAAIDDISKKYKNTLVKDFPKLEIMCIKSAAKKIGEKYGRSLNRKWVDNYESIYTDEIDAQEASDKIASEMQSCKTVDDLLKIWNTYPNLHDNSIFKKNFTSFRNQLNLKK